jgi:PRC-barrel domain
MAEVPRQASTWHFAGPPAINNVPIGGPQTAGRAGPEICVPTFNEAGKIDCRSAADAGRPSLGVTLFGNVALVREQAGKLPFSARHQGRCQGTSASACRWPRIILPWRKDYMTSKFIAAALLSTALVGGAAVAQEKSTTTTTTTTAAPAGQKMMLQGKWRASKLMGLDVYNEANEKLGDINELIVDKDGKILAVVIGVGGFLGMGEHDIAMTMDKLRFVEEPVRTSSTTTEPAKTTTTPTTTGATTTTTTRETTATKATSDWVPDHAVMSGSKDQLKAMPQFKYSDYN